MKFALAVSGRADAKRIERLAVKADETGYDCFLVTDHFMLPGSNDHLDVWSFLPYLAAKTSRVRLGTCVTPLPFRHPGVLAKMVATSDNLSGGRISFGAGFGWYRPEFDAFGTWLEARERIEYSHEAIELMLRLWTEPGPVDFDGRFVKVRGAVLEPKPLQRPHPPILWGGHLPASLRAAARYANGWMPIGPRWFDESYPRPEEYAQMKATITRELRARRRQGEEEGKFIFTNLINITMDLATLRRDIEQYADAGMNYLTLGDKARDDESLRNIEIVAREIGGSL